ncbi:sulfatase-like hydrolase/transferase [Myxococcota bacterium]|nr:sulfatase-like hydrolase/transferase [Myxococcota bacterium]
MNRLTYRFKTMCLLSLICAFVIGILDGILAAATSPGPSLSIFLTAAALTMTVLVAIAPLLAMLIAMISTNSGDLPGLPSRIAAALNPIDPAVRRAGTLLALEMVGAVVVYIAIVAAAGRHFVDTIATDTWAAVATSLVALILGVTIARLVSRLYREQLEGFRKVFEAGHPIRKGKHARFADTLVSPWFVLVVSGVVGLSSLIPFMNSVISIVESLPMMAIGVVLAAFMATLAVGITWEYGRIPRFVRRMLFAGVPIVTACLAVISAAGFLIDDEVRAAFKSDNTVSTRAYDIICAVLDRDGDGLLSIFNDGDCAPDDPTTSTSGIEVIANGIDEDCDGVDLPESDFFDQFHGRWDFPITDEIRSHRYNILLVTLDAAAPDRMSLYGYARNTTPNLSRIASTGALFKRAFATGASTRLSVPAIMTSRYGPQMDVVTGRRVPLEEFPANRLMSEILRSAGYRTYAVTSTLFFSNWKDILRGFDHVENRPAASGSNRFSTHNGAEVTRATIALLEEASSRTTQPFFMWVHFYDLHMPHMLPPDTPSFGKAPADIYDAEMSFLDTQIGRLVDGLDKLYDPSDTILIIMADHGEAFDRNHKGKPHGQDLFTTAVHIPLIVRAPFVKPGVFEGSVSAIDVLPTLVNIIGIPRTFRFSGTSLVPQLVDGQDDVDRNVLSLLYSTEEMDGPRPIQMASVKTMKYNLIWDLDANTSQLFDYVADPYETRNLANSDTDVTRRMKKLAVSWLAWVEARNREDLPDD